MPIRHPFRFRLRDATADCHVRVDDAFSRFDLTDRAGYAAFLTAHARVLLPAEAELDAAALWPDWTPRAGLLRGDLAALGYGVQAAPIPDLPAGAGVRWGMLYVLEGSRLGGAMLARQVAAGLPTAYLGAAHHAGSWGRFGDALEQAYAAVTSTEREAWASDAVAGAELCFAMFEDAAGEGVVGAAGIEPATPPV